MSLLFSLVLSTAMTVTVWFSHKKSTEHTLKNPLLSPNNSTTIYTPLIPENYTEAEFRHANIFVAHEAVKDGVCFMSSNVTGHYLPNMDSTHTIKYIDGLYDRLIMDPHVLALIEKACSKCAPEEVLLSWALLQDE